MKELRHAIPPLLLVATLASPTSAQDRPTLHVDTRWKQCSIVLDPSLTPSAWRQFTREAGQVVYFRPIADARPMGAGRFEISFMQWQTNVDDESSAWNDTFVHPDSTHWLYEGSGLQFPGLAARVGVTESADVGVYFTKNVQANYGAYGVQLQQSLIRSPARQWDVSARVSYVSLFGPEDLTLRVYGADVVTSWRRWRFAHATITPYAGVATYLSRSHERTDAVALDDEHVTGVMGTVGASLGISMLRVGAEASVARVPSIALKVGFAR